MIIRPQYIVKSAQSKREDMISYAVQDTFFSGVFRDLMDFGYNINFSVWGGAGAYMPFALCTENIDSPIKQQQFTAGFWAKIEEGGMKAEMCFSSLLGADINAHYFLHEMMHFYQDMHGLFLMPLQEQGIFPVCLDAKSDIIAILFCEAWAEVEAIRSSWALKEKGVAQGWRGAVTSPDWKDLALAYDEDMKKGVDEAKAAANMFKRWYEGNHRGFYEYHALKIHETNFMRFQEGVDDLDNIVIKENRRLLELPMLLARLPQDGIPKFFNQIEWTNTLYNEIRTPSVLKQVSELESHYGIADNLNIQDIKCGAPPYLWNRLRMAEQKASDVPPH